MRLLKFALLLLVITSCIPAKKSHVDKIVTEFKKSNSPNVLVAAHRGDWRHAPENSIKGIENCIMMGVDIVEVDVRKTKDGELVLMHDATINRMTTDTGKISDYTLDELKQLFLKNNQGGKDSELTDYRVPTLREAMLTAKGKIMINLDKAYGLMQDIYPLLKETGTLDIAIFKGSAGALKVKDDIAFMEEEVNFMPIVSDKQENALLDIKEQIRINHVVAFEILLRKDDSILSKANYMRSNGSRVWVNTLWGSLCAGYTDAKALKEPNGNWGHLIEKGVNIIQTDNPAELLQFLKDKELREF